MNGLQLVILNHTRQQLHEPWALSDKVFGLKWQTLIQGGFGPCEFNMKWWPGADRILNEGRIVLVKYGIRTVYAGRLADPKIGRHSVNICAFGGWETLQQVYGPWSYSGTGNTADVILKDVLADCPLISTDYSNIGSPGFDLGVISWDEEKSAQRVALDLIQTGDDQTPPNPWDMVVLEEDSVFEDTTQYEQVGQSDGDAYDDGSSLYRALADVKVGDTGGSTLTAGLIFESVVVPRNAEILTATLSLKGYKISSPVTRVYGEAADNASLYTAGATHPRNRSKTASYLNMNLSSWSSSDWNDFDVTEQFQEIVDRSGWSSGNRAGMLLVNNGSPTNAYLSVTTFDSVPADAAKLTIIYKAEDVVDLSFVLHYFQRPDLTRANADLVVYASDVVGGKLALAQNLEKLANSVKARYGDGLYTTTAEDADSIAKYDKRMNNPGELNAGGNVTVTVANKVRDAYLAENKDPKWETDKLTLLNVRNRYGQRIHPSTVRAGKVVWFPEFATFDEDEARVFYVMQTEYRADKNQLSINTTSVEKSTAMWLAQMKAKYAERT